MTLLDINEVILGNVELPMDSKIDQYKDLTEDIEKAIELCEGLYNKDHLNLTKSHTEFYQANPLMDAWIDDWKGKDSKLFKKELFYTMICGLYIPKVPSELTALITLTSRVFKTPNKTIEALDKARLKKYVTSQFNEDKDIIKDILDKVFGYEVNLVTKVRPIVTNKENTEVYISNIDSILLCKNNIRDILTDVNDISNLYYDKEKGVVLGDSGVPLRTLINKFGIVRNDMDLREVFLA